MNLTSIGPLTAPSSIGLPLQILPSLPSSPHQKKRAARKRNAKFHPENLSEAILWCNRMKLFIFLRDFIFKKTLFEKKKKNHLGINFLQHVSHSKIQHDYCAVQFIAFPKNLFKVVDIASFLIILLVFLLQVLIYNLINSLIHCYHLNIVSFENNCHNFFLLYLPKSCFFYCTYPRVVFFIVPT